MKACASPVAAGRHAPIVPVREPLDVHHFLVIGTVVVHHREQRDLVMGGGPEHAGRIHQVAVILDADAQPAVFAVR